MDFLMNEELFSVVYRSDSDFIGGIDNEALDFGAALENFIDPPQIDATTTTTTTETSPSSLCPKGVVAQNDSKTQTLPDSPPDSSGSPPSVYSPLHIPPLDIHHHAVPIKPRKRRRESNDINTITSLEQSGTLCELILHGSEENGFRQMTKEKSETKKGEQELSKRIVKNESRETDQMSEGPLSNVSTVLAFDPATPNSVRNDTYQTTYQPLTGYYSYNEYGGTFQEASSNNGDLYPYGNEAIPQTALILTHSPTDESQSSRKRKMDSFDDSSSLASATPDYNNPSSLENPGNQSHLVLELGVGTPNPRAPSTTSSAESASGLPTTPLQCIRFEPFQSQLWHTLCDHQLHDLPTPHYRIDADKGFNFSASDDAFVCQKKNHFQITCHAQLIGSPGMPSGGAFNVVFVRTQNGLEKVRNFCLHFYGVKYEAPRHMIRVEQSQSDRSKKPFHPVVIDLHSGKVSKTTVGRLHFSETTSNNMRKKGRPNPEQRYFRLVVGLHAHTHSGDFPIIAHGSEKIIVRASNPGQFESDFELCWQRGITPDSIFHNGKIGLNTDQPDECLVVNGNLKVTGHILQPSDCRIKKELTELNTKSQLENIQQIRIVRYAFEEGSPCAPAATGVMAQEVRRVLPDAVFEQKSAYQKADGATLDKFLVVNKERIFLENVGAVKELSKVTGNLEERIARLESMQNNKGSWKNFGLTSRDFLFSKTPSSADISKGLNGLGNKSIQLIIIVLVVIMTVCLSTLATLYFIEHFKMISKTKYFSLPLEQESREGGTREGGGQLDQQQLSAVHNLSWIANSNKLLRKHSFKQDLFQSDNDTGQELGAKASGMQNPQNWNNIEFSFLYIYKLQQYYNELRKKVKGKIAMPPLFQDIPLLSKTEDNNEEQQRDEEHQEDEDADCEDTDDCERQLNEEEWLNRLLANILSMKNSTVPPKTSPTYQVDQQPVQQKPQKKGTLVRDLSSENENKEFKDLKDEKERTKLKEVVAKERARDIENLINSN